jgi:oligosaccharide repeat unit polymerase
MSLLFAGSIFSGILVGQPLDIFDIETNVNSLVVSGIIFLCILGFNVKPVITLAQLNLSNIQLNLVRFLIGLSCLAVIVNLYMFTSSLLRISEIGMLVGEFKNSGYGEEFVSNSFDPVVRYLSFGISPISYFCLAAHFYFLMSSNSRMAFFSFVGSLNIVILPLIYFARGGVVVYVLLYCSLLIYVYGHLSKPTKKKVRLRAVLGISPLILIFILISENRFEDYFNYRNGTLVSNPVIYSIFDYFSQWLVNGNHLLNEFDSGKLMYASNFTYIPDKLLGPFGVSFPDLQELRERHFGRSANYFNGMPTLLIYDLGYFLSFIFAFFYMIFVRRTLRKRRHILIRLSWLAVLLPIPLFFFQGLFTVFGFYNLALLYVLLLSIILRLRW